MAISKRTAFCILMALSLFVVYSISGSLKSDSNSTPGKSHSGQGIASIIHLLKENGNMLASAYDIRDTNNHHDQSGDDKPQVDMSIFEDSAIGPFMRKLLTHVYDEKGRLCPPEQVTTGKNRSAPNVITENFDWKSTSKRIVNNTHCDAIIRGNQTDTRQTQSVPMLHADDYVSLTKNCSDFILKRGYSLQATTTENEFPLAFSILTYKDIGQTERLLRAVYRPHNFYCIHLERLSPGDIFRALEGITSCLPNVFLLPIRYHVMRYTMAVLQPELACMLALLHYSKQWRYYINLTGQEFPLVSNKVIVEKLQPFKDINIILGSELYKSHSSHRLRVVVQGVNFTRRRLPTPPLNLTIFKGPVHVAATRAFVQAVFCDRRLDKFVKWLNMIRTPDESFFATLHYNQQLNLPGVPTGHLERAEGTVPPTILRFKQFINLKKCPGSRKSHEICIVGKRLLPDAMKSKAMFANKFHTDYEPTAYDCLESRVYHNSAQELESERVK